jgi:hypothetical protein
VVDEMPAPARLKYFVPLVLLFDASKTALDERSLTSPLDTPATASTSTLGFDALRAVPIAEPKNVGERK